jgi:uncharacterized membrane protein
MKNHHLWLHGELRAWEREGLISLAQAEVLRGRYPVQSQSGWSRLILTALGAIVFGLGAILLIAYNWADMHRYAKLALVFGALLVAHVWALVASRRQRPVASEGLHALGTMLFGAAIWLVAQIYHMDSHYPNAFAAWSAGALLLGWALPSVTQALMAVVLVLVWQAVELFDFSTPLQGVPWLILAAGFPLYWRLRSGVLGGALTTGLIASVALCVVDSDEGLALVGVLFLSGAAVAFGRLVRLSRDPERAATGRAFSLPGQVTFAGILLLLSFPGVVGVVFDLALRRPLVAAYFFVPLGIAILLWGGLLLAPRFGRSRLAQPEDWPIAIGLVLAALFALLDIGGAGWWTAAPFNLLLLALGSLLIVQGARQVFLAKVVIGCLMVSVLAMARYVDLFDSLLMRALVFFVIGGMLFVVGGRYSRRRQNSAEHPV